MAPRSAVPRLLVMPGRARDGAVCSGAWRLQPIMHSSLKDRHLSGTGRLRGCGSARGYRCAPNHRAHAAFHRVQRRNCQPNAKPEGRPKRRAVAAAPLRAEHAACPARHRSSAGPLLPRAHECPVHAHSCVPTHRRMPEGTVRDCLAAAARAERGDRVRRYRARDACAAGWRDGAAGWRGSVWMRACACACMCVCVCGGGGDVRVPQTMMTVTSVIGVTAEIARAGAYLPQPQPVSE
jgi:hypothetical protein